MEKELRLWIDNNEFPNAEEQVILTSFEYQAQRMGGAPLISASFKHSQCLDSVWNDEVYTEFNGEKYFLKQTPSSSLDNTDTRYKHEIELISERFALDNIYFMDVVRGDAADGKYVSNSTKFSFFGNIFEFASRLNSALQYAGLQTTDKDGNIIGYHVVVDDTITQNEAYKSEYKDVSFEDLFLSQALQKIYEEYEIPYYFEGKTIKIGENATIFSDAEEETAFEYGFAKSLLSVNKTNANSRIITRCTGTGSDENIPYYYPNQTELGDVQLNAWKRLGDDVAKADISSVFHFNKNVLDNTFVYKYATDGWTHGIDFLGARYRVFSAIDNADMKFYNNKYYVEVFFNADIAVRDLFRICAMRASFGTQVKCALYFLSDGVFEQVKYAPEMWDVTYTKEHEVGILQNLSQALESQFDKYNDIQFSASGLYKLVVYTDIEFKSSRSPFLSADSYSFTFGEVENPDGWLGIYYRHIREAGTDDGWYLIEPNSGAHIRTELSNYGIKFKGTLPDKGAVIPTGQNRDSYFAATINITQKEGTTRIPFQTNLMPPIYRETKGDERFYNALNSTYEKEDKNTYWEFKNEFVKGRQKEHIEKFEDIKPTIEGVVNKDNKPINVFLEFAYDDDDSDAIDPDNDNEYIHPYFFAKLPKFDGDNGFNLFDQASEKGDMQFSMKTGNCASCTWTLMVDSESKKNTVLVDENGDLLRDENGRVKFGVPQDRQNDTRTNEVWVALKKETDTFGVIMPNATSNYKPSPNDSFVIINISFPPTYITAAEERLKQAILGFMYDNNVESYDFSLKFSRIFLEENESVATSINENSKIRVKYNNEDWDLYVKSYSYKMDANTPLPEISIEVSRKLGTNTNSIQSTINGVERKITERINEIPTLDKVKDLYVRRDVEDTAFGTITFDKTIHSRSGVEFGNYQKNTSGASIYRDSSGAWHQEIDYLKVRKKTTFDSVEIKESHHIGGEQISSGASCVIDLVTERSDDNGNTFYRCYFKKTKSDGTAIKNQWKIGDQALSRTFNLENTNDGRVGDRYWWRLVVNTSNDIEVLGYDKDTDGYKTINANEYHFIDIYKSNDKKHCVENDTAKMFYPQEGDHVVLFGSQSGEQNRTNAIVISSTNDDSPYYRQYANIVDFAKPEYDTNLSPNGNLLTGVVRIEKGSSGAENLDDLPDVIQNSIVIGGENLLRNSGFDGEYESLELNEDTAMVATTETYADKMILWFGGGGTSVEDEDAVSGYSCQLNGSISQSVRLKAGTSYMISFIESGVVKVSVGGVELSDKTFNEEYTCYSFTAKNNGLTLVELSSNDAKITNLKLERGSLRTDWQPSHLDNDPTTDNFRAMWYIQQAITKGKTDILGGLVLTSIINLTNLNSEDVTAGMSGVCNDGNDVAFWGGGDLPKAISSINKVKSSQNLSEEEWKDLIGFCITHGGDAFFKGYVYALGGKFKGTIEATDGVFKGRIEAESGTMKNVSSANSSWKIDNEGNVSLSSGTITNTWLHDAQTYTMTISDTTYNPNLGMNKQGVFTISTKTSVDGKETEKEVFSIGMNVQGNSIYPHVYLSDTRGNWGVVSAADITIDNDKGAHVTIKSEGYVDIGNGTRTKNISGEETSYYDGTQYLNIKRGTKADGETPATYINIQDLPTWYDVEIDTIPVGTLYREGDTIKIKTKK